MRLDSLIFEISFNCLINLQIPGFLSIRDLRVKVLTFEK